MAAPIENAEDLAKQSIIQYGCKEGGSTYNFFKVNLSNLGHFGSLLLELVVVQLELKLELELLLLLLLLVLTVTS